MRRIVENVFSSWANLAVSVLIAFLVSPIIVKSLGQELYGVWTLVVSVTGYFTVLDFGVNTAIVRYISSSAAQGDDGRSRAVYSTSLAIFGVTAALLLAFSAVFGYFFQDLFRVYHLSRSYLHAVFLISALDLAGGLLCSVFLGTLAGLQEFKFTNGASLVANLVKSILLVLLLKHGYGLLAVALMQFLGNAGKNFCNYLLLKKKYRYISFSARAVNRETVRLIYSYSVYSFIIAVALKLLFYTDSVVIGALIGVSEVAFYAIPSTLLDYLEKFVWAMVAVLVPIISANQACGGDSDNVSIYVMGTRYTLLISLPIVISLYFYGGDFMSIWMGPAFGRRSLSVLRYLLIGFGFAFSQLTAHGILKGIGRHKVLALILAAEAAANLAMSAALAGRSGIDGVAVGTMVPLVVASVAIMVYTCKVVGIGIVSYVLQGYSGPLLGALSAVVVGSVTQHTCLGYLDLIISGMSIAAAFTVVALPFTLDESDRGHVWQKMRRVTALLKSEAS